MRAFEADGDNEVRLDSYDRDMVATAQAIMAILSAKHFSMVPLRWIRRTLKERGVIGKVLREECSLTPFLSRYIEEIARAFADGAFPLHENKTDDPLVRRRPRGRVVNPAEPQAQAEEPFECEIVDEGGEDEFTCGFTFNATGAYAERFGY